MISGEPISVFFIIAPLVVLVIELEVMGYEGGYERDSAFFFFDFDCLFCSFFLARPWTWRPESTAGAGVQRDPIDQFDHGHQPAALPVARVHRPARGAALPHVARLPTLPQVSRCFRFCSFYRTDFVAVPSIASRHNVEPFLTVEGLSFLGDDVLAQFRDRVRFSRALTGEKLVQTCYASKQIQLTKTRK